MRIIGLSGGIASGKNFVADIFEKNGAAVFDADAEVHQIFAKDKKIISQIGKTFPSAVKSNSIDRKLLGKLVFNNTEKLEILEKILHPEVRKKYQEFLKAAKKNHKKITILNIPLLLEKSQGDNTYKCDKIISVIVKKSLQKRRFLARARKLNPQNFKAELKNLEKKFEDIFARQITNSERKTKSDFVINSGISKAETIKQVKNIIPQL